MLHTYKKRQKTNNRNVQQKSYIRFIYLIKIKGTLSNNTDTWDSGIMYMVVMMIVMFCNIQAKRKLKSRRGCNILEFEQEKVIKITDQNKW